MKKLILLSATVAVLAASVVTAQPTNATSGVFAGQNNFATFGWFTWIGCGNKDRSHNPQPQPETPAEEPTPAPETPIPTTPVDVPTETAKPVVVVASSVKTVEQPVAELPKTGASDTLLALLGLGALTYGSVFTFRMIKR